MLYQESRQEKQLGKKSLLEKDKRVVLRFGRQ